MTVWYKGIIEKLRASGLFSEVSPLGAKVRASFDETRFLDISIPRLGATRVR